MKKQSSGANPDRQDVSTVTPFPGQSRTGSHPKGVHAPGKDKPTELNTGAAESPRTHPVEMPKSSSRSNSSPGSSRSQSHSAQSSSSKDRVH